MILKIKGRKLKTLSSAISAKLKSLLCTLLSLTLFTAQSRNLGIIRPGIIPGMTPAITSPSANISQRFKAKKYAKAKYSSAKYPNSPTVNKKGKPFLKRTKGFLVYDATNKRIIMEKDSNAKIHPASLTKIMTLYSVIRALKDKHVTLDQEIVISPKAASQARIRLDLPVGFRMSLRTALFAMMTVSANDVTYAIGEALFGDQVEKVFNAYAKELGMKNTSFKNCTGLPNPDQVTTAKDLMRLTLEILRNYPRYMEFGSAKQCCCNGRCKSNTNKLLGKYGVTGFKTGVTNASGYHLITHAKIKNRDIIGVFFGYTSHQERTSHVSKILTTLPISHSLYKNQTQYKNSTQQNSPQSNKQTESKNYKDTQKQSNTKQKNAIRTTDNKLNEKTKSKKHSVKTVEAKTSEANSIKIVTRSKKNKITKKNTIQNNSSHASTSKKSKYTIKTPVITKQSKKKSSKSSKKTKQSIDNFIQQHLSATI